MERDAAEVVERKSLRSELPYAEVFLAVCLITFVLMHAGKFFEERAYCSPLLLATCYGTWRGGKGPGFVSVALGVVMGYYFLSPPRYAMVVKDPSDLVSVALFLLVGIAIVLFGEAQRAERRRVLEREAELKVAYAKLAEANASLDKLVARRTEELREIKNFVAEEL